jgi:hypothetical protein
MGRFFTAFPVLATSSGNMAATASSGGGANANLTLLAAGSTLDSRTISSVAWSYTTAPTSGRITIYDGTTSTAAAMFDLDIVAQGADGWVFSPPLKATAGRPITCVLTQGGSSVYGPVV